MRRSVCPIVPRTALAVVAVLLGPCVLALALGCSEAPPPATPPRPVQTMRVGHMQARVGPRFPGKAKATQEVNLSFRVSGTVEQVKVKIGDRVTAGQVVATLDPRDFQVEVNNAQAKLGSAKAALALAKFEYEKIQKVFASNAANELEVATAREEQNAAAAAVEAEQAKLESAQDALSYATLHAPFDGEVVARYVENFEDISAKDPVLRILDDSSIEMLIYIPEHLMTKALTLESAYCSFDAFPGLELRASFKEIGSEADATTRTYPVTLIMDQPGGRRILPGMTGTAWAQRPEGAEDQPGFVLPITAVGESVGGGRFVFVVDEGAGVVRRRQVQVGDVVLGGVRVTGVEAGEQVVTAGVAFLDDGQAVRLPQAAPQPGDQP